jgi:hypothetical protein
MARRKKGGLESRPFCVVTFGSWVPRALTRAFPRLADAASEHPYADDDHERE